MKCIVKERSYSRLGRSTTQLINSKTLEPIFKDGGILTITTEGYRLATSKGEVLKRGNSTDVFDVVNSLDFDVQPLKVVDEIKGVNLPYEEYQRCYDFANVVRNKDFKRKFYAVVIKDEEQDATYFGITEKAGGLTYAIHSIYVPSALNKFDRAQYLVDYVNEQLFAYEVASIQAVGAQQENVKDRLNKEHIRIFSGIKAEANSEEAEQLAKDAMERKNSISERFEEPIKYEKQRGDATCRGKLTNKCSKETEYIEEPDLMTAFRIGLER